MPARDDSPQVPRHGSLSPLRLREWWRGAARQLVAVDIEQDDARFESEVLLRHVLGITRASFLARLDELVPTDAAVRAVGLLERRLKREPLAYIIGYREFYGLDFIVNRHVLIPRPETEGLVERCIALATSRTESGRPSYPVIADVGTGSGCIAVTLAVHLSRARLFAIDNSVAALAVAAENARRYGVRDRIAFLTGDLCTPLGEKVDIIISNPPYIRSDELALLQPEVARWEPRAALDGGPDGLGVIRRLLAQAGGYLKPGGAVLLEIGAGQGEDVRRLAQSAFPDATIQVEQDLAGLERYVTVMVAA